MPISCGHCKEKHDTVDEVLECSKTNSKHGLLFKNKEFPLTEKQQEYLHDLLSHFGLELEGELTPETISYKNGQPIISALIDARRLQVKGNSYKLPFGTRLLSHPEKGKPRERTPTRPNMPDVPAGHYAVPSKTGNNDFDFYRVDRPTEGQWAGRTYVKVIVGGHPEYKVRGLKNVIEVLNRIVKFGIEKAGWTYGQEIQSCRFCNRHLTEYASRMLSMGPDCAEKRGLGDEWRAVQAVRPEGED